MRNTSTHTRIVTGILWTENGERTPLYFTFAKRNIAYSESLPQILNKRYRLSEHHDNLRSMEMLEVKKNESAKLHKEIKHS
jgi:hypothetical protein